MCRLLLASVMALVTGALVSLAWSAPGVAPSGRWVIRDLGTLGGPESGSLDINAQGQVVGWSDSERKTTWGASIREAFLWQEGRMRGLGASTSEAVAINARGQVVGSGGHAFLWRNGRLRDLGTLGGKASEAVAVNERGQVTGTSDTHRKEDLGAGIRVPIQHPFLWKNARMLDLMPSSTEDSRGVALNDRGQVLIWSIDEASGGLWEEGRFQPLESVRLDAVDALNERGEVLLGDEVWQRGKTRVLGAPAHSRGCGGKALNERGVAAGLCVTWRKGVGPVYIPVVWSDSTPVKIRIIFGDRGRAVALNNRGQVVGFLRRVRKEGTPRDTSHAFVWERGRTTDLGTLGGRSSAAVAISERGQIVGWADTKTGDRHAVLWTRQPAG